MKSLILISGLLLLASCGIYNSRFDCPPGKGIGCAPVNEVLDLIVEMPDGEDVFVTNRGTALLLREKEKGKLISTPTAARHKYYLIRDEAGKMTIVKIPYEAKS